MVAAGYDYSDLSSIEVLSNELSFTNKKLAELPKKISGNSLFLHDDNILLCGGWNNENKCLMLEKDAWKEHSTLHKDRRSASAVTTADRTYIFGGGGDGKVTFEFLPKNSKIWQEGRTKILDRFNSGCAVEVPDKQEILLIGGWNTFTRILKFDIETQTFEEMNVSLIKERFDHTCARLPDTNLIVITGGEDSLSNYDNTSEFLNLEDNTITLGNPMNTNRTGHGMAVITIDNKDRLAVFGGSDENIDNPVTVETLNPITRKWEVSDLKLTEGKNDFGYTSLPNDLISKL